MAQNNDDPWLPLGIGLGAQILAAAVVGAGAVMDKEAGPWVGVALSCVGSPFLFVGLVGLGVLIGLRAHARESA